MLVAGVGARRPLSSAPRRRAPPRSRSRRRGARVGAGPRRPRGSPVKSSAGARARPAPAGTRAGQRLLPKRAHACGRAAQRSVAAEPSPRTGARGGTGLYSPSAVRNGAGRRRGAVWQPSLAICAHQRLSCSQSGLTRCAYVLAGSSDRARTLSRPSLPVPHPSVTISAGSPGECSPCSKWSGTAR